MTDVKTIRVYTKTHKRLTRMGFVGQSISELLEDMIDFIKEHDDEFEEFLEGRYDIEEEDE